MGGLRTTFLITSEVKTMAEKLVTKTYKVIAKGWDGESIRTPDDGLGPVTLKVPAKAKCPSWLEEIKPETRAQQNKRKAAAAKKQEEAEKQQELKDEVSFTAGGDVETI